MIPSFDVRSEPKQNPGQTLEEKFELEKSKRVEINF